MSATSQRTAEAARLACDALEIEVVEDAGPGGDPVARPRSEESLRALIERVSTTALGDVRARPRLAPIGFGSQVGWCRPGQAAGGTGTLFVSTRSIVEEIGGTGIVEYVPGDGTLTALAGASLSDLRAAVTRGGHRLTPALTTTSTIGGALAAGRSGPDRCAFGPARHHVLGMRMVDGSGRLARSGGRLVKNVTGFDLHRLHVGARGTLGVVLEASLRLVPQPEAEAYVVSTPFATDAEAIEAALAIRADRRVTPRILFVAGRAVHIVVAGRSAHVDAERHALGDLCEAADVQLGDDAEARALGHAERSPAVRVQTMPSRVADVVRAIERALGTTDGIVVEPDAALVDLPHALVEGHAAAWTGALLPALDALDTRVERRGRVDPTLENEIAQRQILPGTERLWTRRLVDAFDAAHLFRIDGFPAGT